MTTTTTTPVNREELLQRMAASGRPGARFVEGIPADPRSTEAYNAAKALLEDLEDAGLAVVPSVATPRMEQAWIGSPGSTVNDDLRLLIAASPYRKEA